ncbi:UvrD-helicase domain-containing protein [Acetobacter farinalis]|uniref:DNA 3'-5' helicase n=1 Tax=Acetobacter farinalis TaxID=1260984 RepID=A0ABT3Q8X6_9PROT|nr:UvrD-helicase domain-containing protein [Acetobacter farinalis]MCX2561691.1 UvrD-helicase domain-containing protein [Acetobacter farinalis]NHO30188.1 AAA family ATPase [Acetobacter farinalis]
MSACTPEQTAILEQEPTSSFRVVAGAGCGKTSTLELFSRKWSRHRGLYLAFNAAIAADARTRFPAWVEARTANSYAYRSLNIGQSGRKVTGRYLARDIWQLEKILGCKARGPAETVLKTLGNFLISEGSKITVAHCPEPDSQRNREVRLFVAQAYKYLVDFEKHDLPITHDLYLKKFEREQKITGYDYIMVDEAQDLNPVLLSILKKSGLPIVAVGDPHQSIYAFRGAVDAIGALDGSLLPLTRSWRFGEPVARMAHAILQTHSRPPAYRLHGNPAVKSRIMPHRKGVKPEHDTLVLARTNARLFEGLAEATQPFHVLGGVTDIVQEIRGAFNLYQRQFQPALKPEGAALDYASWRDLENAAEGRDGDPVAKKLYYIVDKHKDTLNDKIRSIETLYRDNTENVRLVCATAHKAKGREFDAVIMLDDFLSPEEWSRRRSQLMERVRKTEQDKGPLSSREKMRLKRDLENCDQEINLLYVACTRAKLTLSLPDALWQFWEKSVLKS